MTIEVMVACELEEDARRLAVSLHDGAEPSLACGWTTAELAVPHALARKPDVLLLEGHASAAATLDRLTELALGASDTRTLLIGDPCGCGDVVQLVRLGVVGCVGRSAAGDMLARAVRATCRGESWFARGALVQALRTQLGIAPIRVTGDDPKLTQREGEILELIGLGLSNKEIGRRLDISDQTVKTHLHRVYAKLHQSGRYKAFLAQPGTPRQGARGARAAM